MDDIERRPTVHDFVLEGFDFRLHGDLANNPQFIVLYLRGGAFGAGDAHSSSPLPSVLGRFGFTVVEMTGPVSSDLPFPRSVDTAHEALKLILSRKGKIALGKPRIVLAGEEAGANIAVALALKARDCSQGGVSGQMLFSPLLDPRMATFSMRAAANIGMRERWAEGWSRYLSEGPYFNHPYVSPNSCTRLAGLPPSLIVTSLDDPLIDESLDYSARLKAVSTPVTEIILDTGSGWPAIYGGNVVCLPEWAAPLQRGVERFMNGISTRTFAS